MSDVKQLTLVIHGSRADDAGLRASVETAREAGHTVKPRVTWEAGDADRFAREGEASGDDAVVAAGGDGTVNEVLNGLRGRTALGILPLGTANDFARQTGIPEEIQHAMDLILTRAPMRMDTAQVNGRRFLNVSSGGIGAEATAETSDLAKQLLGPVAYAATGVRKLVSLEARNVHISGPALDREMELLLFAVGNARRTGAGTPLTPDAVVTDGLLDVVLVEAMPRADFAKLVLRFRAGSHIGEPGVHFLRVPWFTIRCTGEPLSANVDGEPVDECELEYRSRPLDLLVHVGYLPEDAPPANEKESGAS